MMDLAIPEEYERGFVEIRALEEDQVQELVSAFKNEPITRDRAELQRRIGRNIGDDTLGDLDSIIETLFSLYALRDDMGLALQDFIEVVSEMVDQSYIEELNFADEGDRERFEAKLTQLLGIDSLDIAARATDILYERERTIHSKPRVLTDIRPIFGAGSEPSSPRGAMVVHTLKLSYHEGGQIRELFIALGTDNVNELIDVLERAKSKAEALKEFIDGTDAAYIEGSQGW